MKIRLGFVSNSSSSSFIISKKDLNEKQIKWIKNHIQYAKRLFPKIRVDPSDMWTIIETDEVIFGSVSMTNFNMEEYLFELGIPDNKIIWGYRG